MRKEIRRKRAIAFCMKLKHIIETENLKNWEKSEIIYYAILNNVSTTQLNQINIALKNNEEESLYGNIEK